MDFYAEFFQNLFRRLRASDEYQGYRLQNPLQTGNVGHWQQLHVVGRDPVYVSFVKRPQHGLREDWTLNEHDHPFRLEWTLQKGGSEVYNKMHRHRVDIERRIGHELEWEPKVDRVRSIIALYYWGANDDTERIEWVLQYARPFIETFLHYDRI